MRSRFLMIASLILLGIGVIGVLYLKASSLKDAKPSEMPAEVVLPVEKEYIIWTAKRDIGIGESVSREDLRLEKISEADAFELGIKQDVEINFVDGMVARKTILALKPVLPEHIISPNQEGYFNLIIEPGFVPVSFSIPKERLLGGLIEAGSAVDLLVLTSSSQNLTSGPKIRDLSSVSISPLFFGVKVLQVKKLKPASKDVKEKLTKSAESQPEPKDVTLILQLTRKQVAKLTIAQKIAQVEVHLSNGETSAFELSADAGDILSDYKSVRELRARSETIQ